MFLILVPFLFSCRGKQKIFMKIAWKLILINDVAMTSLTISKPGLTDMRDSPKTECFEWAYAHNLLEEHLFNK